MGLSFAIDELYATGWTALSSAGCEYASDGRAYPTLDRVRDEASQLGLELRLVHIQLFDCYRAEWRDRNGGGSGAVVGHCQAEAAVYALSQIRRSMALATA
ncbi:MAG: hypothetical protein RBS39_13815 [Phycisphaerales bacterium]|jgi:hypothetical protein|nr:hypothetical protein [Phycisphaerales bacterium]